MWFIETVFASYSIVGFRFFFLLELDVPMKGRKDRGPLSMNQIFILVFFYLIFMMQGFFPCFLLCFAVNYKSLVMFYHIFFSFF